MKILCASLLLCYIIPCLLHAEGTKTITPLSSDFGCIQFNDASRPFALTTNTDSLYRLYFHISSVSETVYFGFSKHSTSVATSGTFRIKNPSGAVVYAATSIPASGAGFISTYLQATNGPVISGLPAGGYSPLSYSPTTTGDFYIEFASPSNANFRFLYFDLTVTNATHIPIPGRLWSYAWDMTTFVATNPFNGIFFVYTSDRFISKVNLNGIQPFGFVVSCNNTGPGSSGNILIDRKSVDSNNQRPLYKLFLNIPDSASYPAASVPVLTSPVSVVGGSILYGQPVQFSVAVSSPGTIQIYISLDGTAGYQAGTTDIIIAATVVAGSNIINWNGKDSHGNFPPSYTKVSITSEYATGITHLPIWDAETNNTGGFIVNRIKPGTNTASIRWDDSNFISGTANVTGGSGNNHQWTTNFGNLRTMNTWWDGFEYNDTNQYKLIIGSPLPVELIHFSAKISDTMTVILKWTSASETNNDYYTVEKSTNGINFISTAILKGSGNTSEITDYETTDPTLTGGITYYRLKQTDFNGVFTFSNIIKLNYENEHLLTCFPNPSKGEKIFLGLKEQKYEKGILLIYDIKGMLVFSQPLLPNTAEGSSEAAQCLNSLTKGIYCISVFINEKQYNQKLVIN